MTLVAEIARYLNKSPLEIETLLDATAERIEGILTAVNKFNELLYDWVIPRLFNELFDVREFTDDEEYEVELIKPPKDGFYEMSARRELIVRPAHPGLIGADKSFHLDVYCFDSILTPIN